MKDVHGRLFVHVAVFSICFLVCITLLNYSREATRALDLIRSLLSSLEVRTGKYLAFAAANSLSTTIFAR